MLKRYFVSFYAQNSDKPMNTVINFRNIKNITDIRAMENVIKEQCFSWNCDVTIINFQKLERE